MQVVHMKRHYPVERGTMMHYFKRVLLLAAVLAPAPTPSGAQSGSSGSLSSADQSGPNEIYTAGRLCGHPSDMSCRRGKWRFQPEDLSFELPIELIWQRNYYSPRYYAVLLDSRRAVPVNGPDDPCGGYFEESERLAIQRMFPANKAFASRVGCGYLTGISYTNFNYDYNFVALYAGTTMNEARTLLTRIRTTRRFLNANIRQMRTVLGYGD